MKTIDKSPTTVTFLFILAFSLHENDVEYVDINSVMEVAVVNNRIAGIG